MNTYMMSFYDSWLDKKIDIPSLEEYPAPVEPLRIVPVKPENTNQLLMEFQSVYDAVELIHLTPPQTPPQDHQSSHHLNTIDYAAFVFDDHHNNNPAAMAVQQPSILNNTTAIAQSQYAFSQYIDQTPVDSPICNDEEGGLRVVDELLRKCAEELPDCIDMEFQPPQKADSYIESSTAISHSDYDEDDDDFADDSSISMASSSSPSPCSEYSTSSNSNDDEWSPKGKTLGGGVTKRRSTYRRSGEEKKSRKKEQNKNAATRYRRKKKAEIEIILEEENQLKERHDELQTKHEDLKREVKYLKGLMRELFRAKGMLA